ncbi:hypothetical protein Rsub_01405 [Raphidocelis subcapitata]|uniref:ditrans,polycis-polyprenyl diphosphate synthase [(2E,6E)-farnesyldiphosphate specific] n=1 Tax=Raphidocelis subcapitata TaxID=307507 RepID=A0A2V0NN00_9CHLO|nr:hypothetical protein Rsub_01405 [Raphidocelis subcapitata]|eukprot:GBF88906.1 hypothetical protein Rsub_01405 [Raphidocelis subcapitata]
MAGARRPPAWIAVDALIWFIQLICDALALLWAAVGPRPARGPSPAAKTRGSRPSPPSTAGVVFAEPEPHEISLQRAADVALWCAGEGLEYVYLFDPAGCLKGAAPLLARRLCAHPAAAGLELRVLAGWPGLAAAAATAAAAAASQAGGETATQQQAGSKGALRRPHANGAAAIPQEQAQEQEQEQENKRGSASIAAEAAEQKDQQLPRRRQRQQQQQQQQNGSHAWEKLKDTQQQRQPDQRCHTPNGRKPGAGAGQQQQNGSGRTQARARQPAGAPAPAGAHAGTAVAAAVAQPTARRRVTVHLLSAEDSAAPALAAALMPAPAAACLDPCACACADGDPAADAAAAAAKAPAAAAAAAEAADPADPAVVYAQLAAAAGPEVLREPQLLLVYGPALTLAGYPAFHTRCAQIYHLGRASEARADGVRGALERHARALQRHGA